MQIAATIHNAVQIGPDDYAMYSKTYLFSDADSIKYMLKCTGMKDVCDLNLSMVVPDSEYQ
jgi:hypothetical protein